MEGAPGLLQETLWLGILAPLVTGGTLLYVGETNRRRHVTPENRTALFAFSAWWYGLGGALGGFAAFTLSALMGIDDPALNMSIIVLLGAAVSVGISSLAYYLSHLYLGPRVRAWPFLVLGILYLFLHIYRYAAAGPYSLHIGPWQATPLAAHPEREQIFRAISHSITIPLLFLLLMYGSIFFRTHDRAVRIRVALVTTGFFIQIAALVIGGFIADPDGSRRVPIYNVAGLLVSLLVLLAYQPPEWFRRLSAYHAVPEGTT